jgi:hypothetical protein
LATKTKTMAKRTLKEARLQQQQTDAVYDTVLSFSKKRFKKFETVIDALYQDSSLQQFAHVDNRMTKLSICFQKLEGKRQQNEKVIFRRLLLQLHQYTDVLKESTLIDAVFNVCRFRTYWQQSFEAWRPLAKKPLQQLEQLITHLFCKYSVPTFMYKAFLSSGCDRHIEWFIFLTRGGRVKEMKRVPIPFTQKAGHYFLKAPASCTIQEALRWAQAKSLGATDALAEQIAHSWLALKPYTDELFWEQFVRLLAQDGLFNPAKVGELIDYVREEKRLNTGYQLKGRTTQSLLRQSDNWHKQFSSNHVNEVWSPSGIAGWSSEKEQEYGKEVLLLEELCESRFLVAEGKTMHHCVASYAHYCAKGRTAIFSLRKYAAGFLKETLATIEVSLTANKVVQAKAKQNKPISEEVKRILFQWAGARQLEVSPYL